MTPTNDTAIDPLTGKAIPVFDRNYPVVSLYYRLLPVYQKEKADATERYQRTWHDWAVNWLLTGHQVSIIPTPQYVHILGVVSNNGVYTLNNMLAPACDVFPNPDPKTQTVRAVPNSNEYEIVPLTVAGLGTITVASGATTTFQHTQAEIVSALKKLPKETIYAIIQELLA